MTHLATVLAAITLLLVACSEIEASAPTTSTTEPARVTELEIRISRAQTPDRFDPDRPEFHASIRCGETDSGTGYLSERERVRRACAALRTVPAVAGRLINGPRSAVACTEIFGGREVAEITGELAGSRVSTRVNRTDGCGIADWDLLGALLVEPYDEL